MYSLLPLVLIGKQTNFCMYIYLDGLFWLNNLDETVQVNTAIRQRNNCDQKLEEQDQKANIKCLACPLCTKTFIQKRSLVYHLASVHKVINH